MRITRRGKFKRQKVFMVVSAFSLLLFFCVGYAAFSTSITLNAKGNVYSSSDITINDLKNLVVTTGDGLYVDVTENNRYVYKGADPDNYITFNGENAGWRIVSIEPDGTIKIVRDNKLNDTMIWNSEEGNTSWHDSEVNGYLNGDYYNNLSSTVKGQIQYHSWNIGSISSEDLENQNVNDFYNSEKSLTELSNFGLLSLSDVIKAGIDNNCQSIYELFDVTVDTCFLNSYLVDSLLGSQEFSFLINPVDDYSLSGISNYLDGVDHYKLSADLYSDFDFYVVPSVYLKSTTVFSGGNGTSQNPYVIK